MGLGATFAIPAAAQADVETFTVNSTADDVDAGGCEPLSMDPTDDCTLREAVAASDDTDTTDLDTITFAASVTGTITLGGTDLGIDEPLYVNGPGAGTLTVSGNNLSRIFLVTDTPDAEPTGITIEGLTLTDGKTVDGGAGGAIANYNAELTVRNAVITSSYTAVGIGSGQGGGIYTDSDGAPSIIENSTISGNHTEVTGPLGYDSLAPGGGIYAGFFHNQPLIIRDSTISGNYTEGAYARGGGVASREPVVIEDTTISGNHTEGERGRGGGVSARYPGASLTIEDTTISGNYTEGPSSDGGGVYGYQSEVTIDSSTVSGNRTLGAFASGGGLNLWSSPVNVTDSTISGNYTTGNVSAGGGINSDAMVMVDRSTISGNYTTGSNARGGGLYSGTGPLAIEDSTVVRNSTSKDGGGIFVHLDPANPTLTNTVVADNSAAGVGPDLANDITETFGLAFSLVENPAGATIASTVPGSNIFGVDPQLGPLAANGGPTRTHGLPQSSPAVDRGNSDDLRDQRGQPRPFDIFSIPNATGGDGADIGAFELAGSQARCGGRPETTGGNTGTPGRDVIVGTSARDVIRGLGGNDIICGGGGNDLLFGGGGRDKLLGQAGKDKLKGGPKKDVLKGGGGKDTLIGGGGPDKLNGGPGADVQRQ